MELFTFIVIIVTFTRLSYGAFFDLCLISLFCKAAYSYNFYSYDLHYEESSDIMHSKPTIDPIHTMFYVTKYLLHFISSYMRKQMHMIRTGSHNNSMMQQAQTCLRYYDLCNNMAGASVNALVSFSQKKLQKKLIDLFKSIVNMVIGSLNGRPELINIDIGNTHVLEEKVEELDATLDADLEVEPEEEERSRVASRSSDSDENENKKQK